MVLFKKKNKASADIEPLTPLTKRQRELLTFIQDAVEQEGRMPSYREMAHALNVSAVGTIQDHVKVLIEKKFLERAPSTVGARELLRLRQAPRADYVSVPLLGEVAAGSLQEAFEVALGSVPLALSMAKESHSLKSIPSSRENAHRSYFALKVRGESMIAAGILPGDIVVVDREAPVRSKDIVVVEVDGEATVKEWRRMESDRRHPVHLIPHNPNMSPILLSPQEAQACRVLGKVVSVQRYF